MCRRSAIQRRRSGIPTLPTWLLALTTHTPLVATTRWSIVPRVRGTVRSWSTMPLSASRRSGARPGDVRPRHSSPTRASSSGRPTSLARTSIGALRHRLDGATGSLDEPRTASCRERKYRSCGSGRRQRRYSVPRWVSIRPRSHQPRPRRDGRRPCPPMKVRRRLSSSRRPRMHVGGSARCVVARCVRHFVSDDACRRPHERLMHRRSHTRRANRAAGPVVRSRCASSRGDRRPRSDGRQASRRARSCRLRASPAGTTPRRTSVWSRGLLTRTVQARRRPGTRPPPPRPAALSLRHVRQPDLRGRPIEGLIGARQLCDTPSLSFGVWIWSGFRRRGRWPNCAAPTSIGRSSTSRSRADARGRVRRGAGSSRRDRALPN